MKYALNLAEDGRILSATYEKFASADAVFVDELPEGDISVYLYIDGQYIVDPLPVSEEPEPEPTLDERLSALEDSTAEMAEALTLLLSGVTDE